MCCQNGIPGGSISSPDSAGELISGRQYPSMGSNMSTLDMAKVIIQFCKDNGLPVEFGIGLAGVWAAESNIKTDIYNKAEHNNGFAYKNKHAPNAEKFSYGGQTYYKDQANMMKFGYGKGLAQWSWSRNFKFRDWYNSGADGYKTPGLNTMDTNAANITATTVETQTAFAWKEMQERTGQFMSVVNSLKEGHVSYTENEEKFKANITTAVDAVLRGFENGSAKNMASTKQIDKYTWDGGYSGAMKKRVGRAIGFYEELKKAGDPILS